MSQAVVVAFGVAADGRREVLGFDVGDSKNEGFWAAFLRSLKARGLDGVKLVISDAHSGPHSRPPRLLRRPLPRHLALRVLYPRRSRLT
ncbi:transposase-like protein [Arthrobacter sp. UYEF36]